MGRTHLLGLAVLAMFAFAAVTASSAFGEEEHQFLLNGSAITINTPTTITGELLQEDMSAPGGKVDLECSIFLLGFIIGDLFLINHVEDLVGNLWWLEVEAENKALECKYGAEKGACTGTPLVTPVNLDWDILIELVGAIWVGLFTSEVAGQLPGYTVDCNTLLGLVSDSCTGAEANVEGKNTETDVEMSFGANEEINKPGSCSLGGTGAWLTGSLTAGLLTPNEGGTLSMSP